MIKKILIGASLFFILISPANAFAAASLSLSPSAGTFNKGCTFSVKINVDTGGIQTDGTDAVIKYDPSVLSATITSGTIYNDYPGNNVDSANGKITVSGLASVSQAFSGTGTLATLNFTVSPTTPASTTAVTFDFDPNNKAKTTDSNIVERGTTADVLNSVVNGSYTIGSGSCVGQGAGTSTGTGTGQGISTPSATQAPRLPEGGSEQFTFTLAIMGTTLTVLGIFGLLLL